MNYTQMVKNRMIIIGRTLSNNTLCIFIIYQEHKDKQHKDKHPENSASLSSLSDREY